MCSVFKRLWALLELRKKDNLCQRWDFETESLVSSSPYNDPLKLLIQIHENRVRFHWSQKISWLSACQRVSLTRNASRMDSLEWGLSLRVTNCHEPSSKIRSLYLNQTLPFLVSLKVLFFLIGLIFSHRFLVENNCMAIEINLLLL